MSDLTTRIRSLERRIARRRILWKACGVLWRDTLAIAIGVICAVSWAITTSDFERDSGEWWDVAGLFVCVFSTIGLVARLTVLLIVTVPDWLFERRRVARSEEQELRRLRALADSPRIEKVGGLSHCDQGDQT